MSRLEKEVVLRSEEEKNVLGRDRNYHLVPEVLLQIEDAIIEEAEITRHLLRSDSRQADLVRARHMVWYVARDALGMTLTRIARIYRRDHTTVIHGIERVEREGLAGKVYGIIAKRRPKLAQKWG